MSKEVLVQVDIGLYYAYGVSYEILNEQELELVVSQYGKELYLGEISGKHSEVVLDFDPDYLKIISTDVNEIAIFRKLFGEYIGEFSILQTIKDQTEDDE